MNEKRVVILGAGVGGLVVANELRRLLPREHRIALVDRNPQHVFAPSFLWLMTGERQPAEITRQLSRLVLTGVEVIQAQVQRIDLDGRGVQVNTQVLPYDYLVLALGAELAPERTPGLAEAAHTFYTFDGAVKLHNALQNSTDRKIALVVTELPYKCPAAPYEGAMLIADFFRKRGLKDEVELHVFTPEPQPMPVAGPELGEAVKGMLGDRGIFFHPLHKLTAVSPRERTLYFGNEERVPYDMLVVVPPHRGPRLVREGGLANDAGWVSVDPATLATKHENVYAIGDITAIPLPGRWKTDLPLMLPKAGVFAHAQALVVARRIAAQIAGAKTEEKFCGEGYCMLEAGEHLAGLAFGNFFAEPSPQVQLRKVGKIWHLAKVLFEQWWLAPLGLRRRSLGLVLKLSGKALGIRVVL